MSELGLDWKKLLAKADFPPSITPNEANELCNKNVLRDAF
jgi:hypothetical protein